jgi:HEAT repeat protein
LHLASYLATRWQEPCEGAFEYLAASHPSNLFDVISSGLLDPADLTFAAEIAGRVPDSKAVRRALLPLLSHREAVVREGAIYGLHQHTDDVVRESLERIAAGDASSAVRRAAVDALEGV